MIKIVSRAKMGGIFKFLGLVSILFPIGLTIARRNYEVYIWLINGPYPFSQLGSGPFMLLTFLCSFLVGYALFSLGLYFSESEKR